MDTAPSSAPTTGTSVARALPEPRGLVVPPALALGAAGLGAVGVVAVWFAGLSTAPGPWHAVGRLSGLLAAYLMVVLVYLVARVPALERGAGADRLTRWHTVVGKTVIALVAVHVLTLAAGRGHGGGRGGGPFGRGGGQGLRQAGSGAVEAPHELGTLAVVAIVVLGVVSVLLARRVVRYSTWHGFHLLGYAVVVLVFAHLVTTGRDVAQRPAVLVVWGLVLGAGVVTLVVNRAVRPLVLDRRHRLRVSRVVEEAPGVTSVYVTGERLDRWRAASGQFFRWRFLAPGLRWSANPYSLSAPPTTAGLRLTAAQVGDHSGRLPTLRPGTRVLLEGPSGAITPRALTSPHVVLMASGTGITPVRALAESLGRAGRDVTVVYRARDRQQAVLADELERLAVDLPVRVHLLLGRRTDPACALTPARLLAVAPRIAQSDVFVCGSAAFTAAARQAARDAGTPPQRVHTELFSW